MKHEIKPKEVNINLMISINELHELMEHFVASNDNFTIVTLRKIGNLSYEIPDKDFVAKKNEVVYAKLYEADVFRVLNATRGLYALRDESDEIDEDTKFRIELKKEGEFWTQDTGE